MEEITHLEQYRSFSTAVQQLAKEIVTQRMQLNRPAFLAQAAPLFASLHAVNRKSSNWAVHAKGTSAEARKSMDQQHLLLQNLLFERNHLEKEITNCQRFDSQYLDLPIHSLEELHALAQANPPPKALSLPLPTDFHQLMLARLEFELAERQRYDDEKKELGLEKNKLIKENEQKKLRLEDLEKQVDDLVATAREIQGRMANF